MDRAREYREYLEQQQARPGGVAKDLQRIKADGGASAAELREFLGHLKGRSPQEVMGVVAESDLFRSILTATAGCVVLLVVLTIVPYAIQDRSASVAEEQPAAAVTDTSSEQPTAAETSTPPSQPAAGTAAEPDLERAAEAMGIGGTAEADPQVNPLDSKLDKLLDGIE